MIAFLIDDEGVVIEQLYDIPIHLTFDEMNRDYWNFPIESPDPHVAYDKVSVRISAIVDNTHRQRCLMFTDKELHQAVLNYRRNK